MRTLIVVDSEFGNTEALALVLAAELGHDGPVCLARPAEVAPADLAAVERLLVGGPTQHRGLSPRLAAFLDALPAGALAGRPAAAFDTRSHLHPALTGSAARGAGRRLRELGARLIVPPESFTVNATEGPLTAGEADRARAWAALIRRRAAGSPPPG